MSKLITAYMADKSDKNRARLVAYVRKHPMAACMASADEIAVLREVGAA